MIRIRRDEDIFDTDGGWFRARWHFSFDRTAASSELILVDVPMQFEPVGIRRGLL